MTTLFSNFPASYFYTMKFENDKGEQVEISFQNFKRILPGAKPGFTPVKFKNGKEEWLQNEILEATAEE